MRKGFTLIEILIVVAIIAILASIVLVGLGPTQQSGRDARRLSDLHEIQNALELYYGKCGYYPGAAANPCATTPQSAGSYTGVITAIEGSALNINTMPVDPTAGHQYFYDANSTFSSYVIGATLENTNNSAFTTYTPPQNLGDYTNGDPNLSCVSPNYCLTL